VIGSRGFCPLEAGYAWRQEHCPLGRHNVSTIYNHSLGQHLCYLKAWLSFSHGWSESIDSSVKVRIPGMDGLGFLKPLHSLRAGFSRCTSRYCLLTWASQGESRNLFLAPFIFARRRGPFWLHPESDVKISHIVPYKCHA
jgi:hypothetical protein